MKAIDRLIFEYEDLGQISQEEARICRIPLSCPSFMEWPASISKHHFWGGGLLQHTTEVVNIAMDLVQTVLDQHKPIRPNVVLMAAIYHDFGKVFDYEEEKDRHTDVNTNLPVHVRYKKTAHYGLVHHVAKSYQVFEENAPTLPVDVRTAVSHCILAHHGRLEYGSPVLPNTREAWTVHLADMMSVHCIEERKGE